MSTRCQILFKNKWKCDKRWIEYSVLIYRHSDGYPSAVIPDLKKFFKWNAGRNDDIEYTAANFIYWSKRQYEELYFEPDEERKKWSDNGSTNCSNLHIGFGICPRRKHELHGDIEWFYEVELLEGGKQDIKVFRVSHDSFDKPLGKENLHKLSDAELKKEMRDG